MREIINTITTGNYKKCVIMLKGEDGKEPVLSCKSFLKKMELPMDKTTIRLLKHSILENKTYDVIIEWKDGKLSQAVVDNMVYSALIAKLS